MSIISLVYGINYKTLGYDVVRIEDGKTVYTYMYTGEEDENWVDPKLKEYMNNGFCRINL